MRIAVVGTGGVGGLFGGLLARHGEDVTFIARGANLDALRERGLTVRSTSLGDFTVPVRATDQPRALDPPDLVLFCVKTYDLEPAAEQIRPLVGPSTVVVPLQNGIDATERLGRIVGEDAVLVGITYVSSTRTAPATIDHTANTRIILGEPGGGLSPRVEAIADALRRADIDAEVHSDPLVPLWEKFVGLSAFAGMAALTRLPVGPILACPETHEGLFAAMEEVVAVGRALGVALPADCVDRFRALGPSLPPGLRPSMAVDLETGRRLELESLNGVVVRLGRDTGVPTPMHVAIYAALKPYLNGAPALL